MTEYFLSLPALGAAAWLTFGLWKVFERNLRQTTACSSAVLRIAASGSVIGAACCMD